MHATIEEEIKTGKFTTFRELLKKGIGLRTQKNFAEETGLSRGSINRLLNQDIIQRPTEKTLLILSSHMTSVSANDLLSSCGYDIPKTHEVAAAVRDKITKVMLDSVGNVYESEIPETVFEKETFPYITKINRWKQIADGPIKSGKLHGESFETWRADWAYGDEYGKTYFTIGKVDIKMADKCVLCGFTTDIEQMTTEQYFGKHTDSLKDKIDSEISAVIMTKEEMAAVRKTEDILNEIFRTSKYGTYTVTNFGCGFYYHETPETFKEYVMANAEYFCVNKENQALYNKLVGTDESPDEIFREFSGRVDGLEQGTGCVIADILTNKTGQEFLYFQKDSRRGEDAEDDSCIMCPSDQNYTDDDLFDKDVLRHTYEAAVALGIKKFGMVYCEQVMDRSGKQEYNTETFHYSFRSNEDIKNIVNDREVLEKLYQDARKLEKYYTRQEEPDYDNAIRAGRISVIASNALQNKDDTEPTYDMVKYVEEKLAETGLGDE